MLRDAEVRDVEGLLGIERRAFDPALYPQISRRQFLAHVGSDRSILKIVERDGAVLGYALSLLHQGHSFLRFYSLAVEPVEQGGDIGRQLFADVEAEAAARGLGVICEVRSDNQKLRNRYLKLGYKAYREVPDYYPDGASCIKFRKPFHSQVQAGANTA